MMPSMGVFSARVIGREWLSAQTFEIRFSRPPGMAFTAGQKIRFLHEGLERDYSLTSAPDDDHLAFCVRLIPGGRLTPVLADAPAGRTFAITAPFGFFTCRVSERPLVLAATGTGIAPFVSFARSGVRDFTLLHGVRSAAELYYRRILSSAARSYVACLSRPEASGSHDPAAFGGRLTDYLEMRLAAGNYDFYLCGRREMVRDATRIIDRKFPDSRLFSEIFF